MAASKINVTVSSDNGNTYVGNNMTINNYGQGPDITLPVSNCCEPVHYYWPRKKLDAEIKNVKKGKPKILRGTFGTGKTSAALHHIILNKQNFALSWIIRVSGKDSISNSLECLAAKLGVSYDVLFETIEQNAKNKEIIFLLDNVGRNPKTFNGFEQLWNIRRCVYIMMTTNNPSLDLPDAEKLEVEKFDEALDFLRKNIPGKNSEEDLKEICRHFDWNVLGLAAATDYMSSKNMDVGTYLKMLRIREAAKIVREAESEGHKQTLYQSVRLCLEEIDDDKFDAIAATSLVSNNMIPEFLLSNLLPSKDLVVNQAALNNLHGQLKSLVCITTENGIQFFSFNSFTQHVIRDMIDESKKAHLLYKLAGIFVRHISKDNRFSKGDFLQRTVREHAEIFLREWEDKQKDDRTLIALARLSELVGFTYTQQQPFLEKEAEAHFERARKMLHELCGITDEDLQPSVGFVNEILGRIWGLFQVSSEDRNREIYDITKNDLVVAHQLFEKLSKKSSELSPETVQELVFLRTVSKQDLSPFPPVVKENQTVKKKFDSAEPLSPSDVNVLVHHRVAYSVDQYGKWFLPELYLSVIYSFGRNYFYMNRATIKNPHFYINLLKLAYCLSREISQQMNDSDNPGAVFHEFLVQTNGLLYLLVNNDCFNQDDARVTKEAHIHARDLENAIYRYQQLICDERRFFEMGILKRTKDDTYSKLICYQQILKCYKNLLSPKNMKDHEKYIENGVQRCRDVFKLLDTYGTKDVTQKKDDLVRYSRHMNAIAEFYLSIDREEYYAEVKKIFTLSAEHAEYHNLALYQLEALVGLADVFSRIGKNRFSATQISICHVNRCNSNERLLEVQRQKPDIQERIRKIQKQNFLLVLQYNARLRRQHKEDGNVSSSVYIDESDDVDSKSSNSSKNGDDDGESNETFEGDAVETTDEDIIAEPVLNKGENEELPEPDISGVESGTAPDRKADEQPQVLKKEKYEESLFDKQPDYVDEQDLDMSIHLQKLAFKVPKDWDKLARLLRVSDEKIGQITANNRDDVLRRAYEVLKYWWLNYGKEAHSWREELGKALRGIDRHDLAKEFTGDVFPLN